jgi:hypothetical protein
VATSTSSSTSDGDRRADSATEYSDRPAPPRRTEVLDSRRAHRGDEIRSGKDRPDEGPGRRKNGNRSSGRNSGSTAKRPAARSTPTPGVRPLDDELVVEVKPLVRSNRSDPEARRERIERRRRRMAIQRQITFGLMGRRTDPEAETTALPRLEQSKTGSIKVAPPRTDRIRMETPRSGAILLQPSDEEAEISLDERSVTHGRRAGRLQTSTRRSGVVGRAARTRRIWGTFLAVILVLILPSTSLLNRPAKIADTGLNNGGEQIRAAEEFPTDTAIPSPTTSQTQAAKAKTKPSKKAKPAKKATAKATTKARKTTSGGGTVSLHLAGLSDARSDLGWPSGVFMPGGGPSAVTQFGNWRGAGVDAVVDYSNRQTWDDIVNPTWLYQEWANVPYTKVFAVAPVPEGDSSATMAGCAAGDYNDKWLEFGKNIESAGIAGTTVIRLGWEFNGDWYKWQASNPAQFAECWRQIVGTVKTVAPQLAWDWNVNRGKGASVTDAAEAYPGDKYVDIVGIDSYDMWPGVTSASAWQEQYAGAYGLKHWVDFATTHGKKVSVPEWGVYPASPSTGGDNPYYIQKMEGFFKSLGSQLAYESYFNESASYYGGSLFGPDENPKASAEYKSLFGG